MEEYSNCHIWNSIYQASVMFCRAKVPVPTAVAHNVTCMVLKGMDHHHHLVSGLLLAISFFARVRQDHDVTARDQAVLLNRTSR